MENIKVSNKRGKLVIEIPIKSIIKECENEDWNSSHTISKVKKGKENKTLFSEFLLSSLDNPSVDLGDGYVTPIENMIMDIVQEASIDAMEFMADELDEDDE